MHGEDLVREPVREVVEVGQVERQAAGHRSRFAMARSPVPMLACGGFLGWEGVLMAVAESLPRRLVRPCAASIVSTMLLVGVAQAATVINNDDDGPGSLRRLVSEAADGDTIDFAITGEILLIGGEINITVDLTIAGPGVDVVSIIAGEQVFRITNNATVTVSGLSIEAALGAQPAGDGGDGGDGTDGRGGVILNNGNLTLSDCEILGSVGGGPGGTGGDGGVGPVSDPDGGNGGDGGDGGSGLGGAIFSDGTLRVFDCMVKGFVFGGPGVVGGKGGAGVATGDEGGNGGDGGMGGAGGRALGGAIYNAGSLEVVRSTIEGSAQGGGGGDGGAGGAGAADADEGGNGGNGGAAGAGGLAQGGAIYSEGAAIVRVRNSAIVESNALGGPGGDAGDGGDGGIAGDLGGNGGMGGNGGNGGTANGGGIFAILAIVNSTLSEDDVFGGDGGAAGDGGNGGDSATQGGDGGPGGTGGNGASSAGGGAFFFGQSILTYVTVAEGNFGFGDAGAGGAGGDDGGMGNSTSGAKAPDGPDGANDLAVGGAGIFGAGGIVSRSLFANNDGVSCGGTFTSGGFNLSSDASCAAIFTQPTDLPPNTDPMIEDLALNAPGHTPTHALPLGSPALNRIPDGSCVEKEDQRGVFRPQGSGCDIGAYERVVADPAPALGSLALVLLAGLLSAAGMLTLRRRAAGLRIR